MKAVIPSCIQRRTEAATRSRPSQREDRRRREQGELRGWLHPALLVEGATRAPVKVECDEDTLTGHRDNEGESKKATWYQVS
jgi:hypothetical protein